MADRRKEKKRSKERKGEKALLVHPNGEKEIVDAIAIAERIKNGEIWLKKAEFICLGFNEDGVKCNCKLSICNITGDTPYFAHRVKQMNNLHVEGCNYAVDSIEVETVTAVDERIESVNYTNFIIGLIEPETPGTRGGNPGPEPSPDDDEDMFGIRGGVSEIEKKIIPIRNLSELYACAVETIRHDRTIRTADGILVEDLLINSDTITKHRSDSSNMMGYKLIVADPARLIAKERAQKMKELVHWTSRVLTDPYKGEPRFYYVLDYGEDKSLSDKYWKRIQEAAQRGLLLLIAGPVKQLHWNNSNEILVRIMIADAKLRQMTLLKNSKEDDEMIECLRGDRYSM